MALFPELAAQGMYIAMLTTATGIAPGSRAADAVTDAFWRFASSRPPPTRPACVLN
jgi:hypothetical protein